MEQRETKEQLLTRLYQETLAYAAKNGVPKEEVNAHVRGILDGVQRNSVAPVPPPPAYRKLFDSFDTWARRALDDCGETHSLLLVVPWQFGANELPPGAVALRRGAAGAQDLRRFIEQLQRMAAYLSNLHMSLLVENERRAEAAAKEVKRAGPGD